MGKFLQIKSKFEFLVKEFNFQIIGEKTSEISAYDFQCDIVKYINNYVLIEIGSCDALSGFSLAIEIRRLKNHIPARYDSLTDAVNLRILKQISEINNQNQQKFQVSSLDELANLIKQNINFITTTNWFPPTLLIELKSQQQIWKDDILEQVEKLNKEFLNSKGFYFLKSSKTISSFEECDGPFFIYSNGKENLVVKYECDVRDQYFCYNIHYTGKKSKGIFPKKDTIKLISEAITQLIK